MWRCFKISGVVLGLSWCTTTFANETGSDLSQAQVAFLAENPGAHFYVQEDGRITRIYGQAFGTGQSPEQVAEDFVTQFSDVFGVSRDELIATSDIPENGRTQPVMYDRDSGSYKFTLVYYSQFKDDIPVFRSDLLLLVRNEEGFPLVLAGSSLRDLGDFEVPAGVNTLDTGFALNAITKSHPDLFNMGESRLVVWAGVDNMDVDPALAIQFIADNGLSGTADYQKVLFLVDAQTGEILYEENQILNKDVEGNVSGMATQGLGADVCGPEELQGLPFARVSISGGSTAFADVNGDFVIPNNGNGQVTVTSEVRGKYFRVVPQSGSPDTLTMSVTPPGPANFVHNAANNDERNRAQTNGYIHANVVRDFVLVQNPDYPTIKNQTDWPVNVNLNQNCNAFYDGRSINFFTSGGGCSNTANSTVIYHEYGHHVVANGGSGQGQYGEGMADALAVLITDDPRLALGFFANDCNQPIRDTRSGRQYPCRREIHFCGEILSGSNWDTRNALMETEPERFREILSNLAVNAVLLHRGGAINPQITIDYVTLDDDDDNLNNGTPHYYEIDAGFSAHNMDAPPINARCENIKKFASKCKDSRTIKSKVRMRDSSEDGNIITFNIDGVDISTSIVNQRAKLVICCYSQGPHDVTLSIPADCLDPITVSCP